MTIQNLELERAINEYKTFYSKYLLNFKLRNKALRELYPLIIRFQEKKPRTLILVDNEAQILEQEAESVLNKYFNKDILALYKKELPKVNVPKKFKEDNDNSFWLSLFASISNSLEELKEQYKHEWNYKTNFLIFLNSCLTDYGLHKNILLRDPNVYKKFNLKIQHYYRSRKPLIATKVNLTYEEFEAQFIKFYIKQKPIKFNGLLIPFDKIHEVKITTTLLKYDEIPLFAERNNFNWTDDTKDILSFIDCCNDETEKYHPNPFDENTYDNRINLLVVAEVSNILKDYPDSHKLYTSAIAKFEKNEFQRNVLDDLRLSLELLLRNIFNNSKVLEKQVSEIGQFQKRKGTSIELTNMFQKLIDYYSKYQNNYIKHDDKVKINEIEFVIDLTSSFLKFIVKK